LRCGRCDVDEEAEVVAAEPVDLRRERRAMRAELAEHGPAHRREIGSEVRIRRRLDVRGARDHELTAERVEDRPQRIVPETVDAALGIDEEIARVHARTWLTVWATAVISAVGWTTISPP